MGARDKLRLFFEKNVGKVLTTKQLGEVAGISEYARRIRELRDEEGMQIHSHIDRNDLKPGQYVLESLGRVPKVARGISPRLRNEILKRNGHTCQICGAVGGDMDLYNPKRVVRFHIDHLVPISRDGKDTKKNLRVLCSTCNQVRRNFDRSDKTASNILALLRHSPKKVRRSVYEELKRVFER